MMGDSLVEVQSKLLERASSLLVHILGVVSTSSKAEVDSLMSDLDTGQLHSILEEVSALWESVRHDPDNLYRLAACVANVEAVLETICDFLFRMAKCKLYKLASSGVKL